MSEIVEDFKVRLCKAMDARGIKPVELSEMTLISKSTISHYMSGYTKPKSDKLYLIAKALDVNEAWLMGYDVPMEKSSLIVGYELQNILFKISKDLQKNYDELLHIFLSKKSLTQEVDLLNEENLRIFFVEYYKNISTEGANQNSISALTPKDERDIAKDLDSIMRKLTAGEAGPAAYDGEELDPEAAELFKDELEIALRRLKMINKEKYTPKKYKK